MFILYNVIFQFRKILVTYINSEILLEDLQNEMRAICQFSSDQEFTMKWIDEEGLFYFLNNSCIPLCSSSFVSTGDPCTISSQVEIDEAIRLYEVNNDSEITIHGEIDSLFEKSNILFKSDGQSFTQFSQVFLCHQDFHVLEKTRAYTDVVLVGGGNFIESTAIYFKPNDSIV